MQRRPIQTQSIEDEPADRASRSAEADVDDTPVAPVTKSKKIRSEAQIKAFEKARETQKIIREKRKEELLKTKVEEKQQVIQKEDTEKLRREAEAEELRRQFEELKKKMEETRGSGYDVRVDVKPLKQRGRPRSALSTDEKRAADREKKAAAKIAALQEKERLKALESELEVLRSRSLPPKPTVARPPTPQAATTESPAASRAPSPVVGRPQPPPSPFMNLLAGRRRR
jgi:hypothetical protein